ncbi:hypothetical protein HYH02_010313 [Chlamydomonas schloesseri]|uniref:Uncharacterized protein n=1 Tax=Chlamydomonas schloesseri TaxID=2026947 RepID=A0A835W7P0_9CHLO|nr:hypothetical protein HYH02_010313 [Chlamydomonas schloesseri]|eukprot:KAG2440428.1 hypothetical protein HYH02_010313 [Chlamydomonas schloesseri]
MDWSQAFRCVARRGAGGPLLRLLHERHGAAIDLVAVAEGGSEAHVEVAVQTLGATKSVGAPGLLVILRAGNWAAVDRLLLRGLTLKHEVVRTLAELRHAMLLDHDKGPWRVPMLQWMVDRCGLEWTADCAQQLEMLSERCRSCRGASPSQMRWQMAAVQEAEKRAARRVCARAQLDG